MHAHIPPLLVVLAVAVAAPLIGEVTRRIGLSIVVLELVLGVAIGPQGLGWAAPDAGAIPHLANSGMAFLFFLAGLESTRSSASRCRKWWMASRRTRSTA